jgi:two-component system nitrate/nitrite sensor histidine kinase NarX
VSRDNCSKAGFETLLTVPVTLNHRVHGEVDLFYRTAVADTDPVRSLIELLASHLAGGMQGLRAVAADKEAAVSNERGLLAQELHDSIAQSLAFLKIQVQLLRGAISRSDPGSVQQAVDEIDAGVKESYSDVRELLVHFRTRADAEEIEPALRTTLHKFHNQTGIATDIEIEGHGVALPNDVQVQVLHVVQEALSNIRKHARASSVTLRVRQAPSWRFEVTDDGVGFETEESIDDGHVGLRIMSERVRRIGGELSVTSRRGQGTTVSLTLAPSAAKSAANQEVDHVLAHSSAGR